MRVRGCALVKSPKVKHERKAVSTRKCVDDDWAEAGGRRAILAELAEFGIDTKKNLL